MLKQFHEETVKNDIILVVQSALEPVISKLSDFEGVPDEVNAIKETLNSHVSLTLMKLPIWKVK